MKQIALWIGVSSFIGPSAFADDSIRTDSCEAPATNLRVVDKKGVQEIQLWHASSNDWKTVVVSKEKILLPVADPNEDFLAYVSDMHVRDKVTPWLYLQRVSNGWREAVEPLEAIPKRLCFEGSGTHVKLTDSTGASQVVEISEQIKLLTKHQ